MPGNNKPPVANGGTSATTTTGPDLSNRIGVDPAVTGGAGGSTPLAAAATGAAPKRPLTNAIRPCDLSQTRLEAAKANPQAHFHKNLAHDADGNVDAALWVKFLDALKTADATGNVVPLAQVPAGPRKWVNPLSGWAVDTEVSDPCPHYIPAPPALDSAEAAAEMLELYWHALLRDVPFADWPTHPDVAAAAAELGGLKLYIKRDGDVNAPPSAAGNGYVAKPLSPANLFRGGDLFAGDADREKRGPFVSQFLYREVAYGSLFVPQRQMYAAEGVDYVTDAAEWRAVQNGESRDAMQNLVGRDDAAQRRHFLTMRDLCTYVHFDQLYEAYLNAALILMADGYPLNVGNPYSRYCDLHGIGAAGMGASATVGIEPLGDNQIGFGTFGGPHILSLVTEVATRALKTVWRQKWTHLRLRPEAYAGLLHHGGPSVSPGTFGTAGEAALTASLNSNGALARTSAKHKGAASHNYLLPLAFPEGSPTHPSYGAGHACVAGACVTILKAFFDGDAPIQNPVVPSADGKSLTPYTGTDAGQMTVGSELDKLAANIAVARDMAGVHYRSDFTQSALLGQRVATDVLYRQCRDYAEEYCFHFTTFGGGTVDLDAEGVVYTDPAAGAQARVLEGSNNGIKPPHPVDDHGHADRLLREEDAEIATELRKII